MNMTRWKEVTDWEFPNHTYVLDNKGWLIAYIKQGTTDLIHFSTPMKQFSKTRRKFIKI